MKIRVGVIGAGLIGQRRAYSVANCSRSDLLAVADVDEGRAQTLAIRHACRYTTDWREIIADPNIDAVVVSTVNKFLSPISIAALQEKKHVLCEKPLSRNTEEAHAMVVAARDHSRILKVGFTLRFHPALKEAHRLSQQDQIGPLYFVRAAYGHGGRPGYAQEWRGNRELAGGGELLDQGVHLIDLARWFLGDFAQAFGLTPRWFWEVAPLEDNAFMLLTTRRGQIATLHTSWTQWRNHFRFEVYGRDGYLKVDGLGGSYGPETLTIGRRDPESGPPAEDVRRFDGPDQSWADDWSDFVDAVQVGRRPAATGEDGLAVMQLVEAIYNSSSKTYVQERE